MEGSNFERFAQMLSSASKTLQRLKSKYMSRYGLTSTHTVCLRQLYDNPDGLTKSEMAEGCEMDKAQITRIMTELISKGYAESDSLRKAYNRKFFLTEVGRQITQEINDVVNDIVRYVNKDIPREDVEHFYAIFEIINKKLRDSEEYIKEGFEK